MRVMKKKTVIIACALSALLFVSCGKSAEFADVSDAAPVESVTEEVKESVTETEGKDKETAASVSGNDENSEVADEGAPNENTTGGTVDGKNTVEKTGEASQATTQENAQANQDLQMVEGVDYSEWTKRQTWTASNGVTLKIKDSGNPEWAGHGISSYIIMDGDRHPTSPFMQAIHEFTGNDYLNISASDLPNISNSTVKRTSFPNSDPVFLDYQSKANYLFEQESSGSGLGLYADNVGVSLMYSNSYAWKLDYSGSYWTLIIRSNLSEIGWNALKNCIKLVSPDGQLLYDVIYTDFFEGSDYIEDYDMWCPVEGSEIYQLDPEGLGYVEYHFR